MHRSSILAIGVATALLTGGSAVPAHAVEWLVKADGTGDAPTIQAGIDSAAAGDTVLVDDGTFTGPGNRGIDFTGKDVVVRSVNGASLSILDAGSADRLFVLQSGETGAARIEGLTLRDGLGIPNGGGIYCDGGSSPTIADCVIENCHATERGGGVELRGGSNATIEGCTIRNNSSTLDGGGVCAFESSPDITNTVFDGNRTGEYGGGLLCHESSGAITGCEFRNNFAGWGGGGISMWVNTTATFSNCIVEYDSCGAVVGGGGLHVRNSSPAMSDMTIRDNVSDGRGGGIHYTNGSAGSITDSEIARNTAVLSGGGIDAFKSSPTLTDLYIGWNEAGEYGGGILCDEFTNTIERCVVYGNTGALDGGGISVWSNSSATLRSLTIACNETGGDGGGIHARNSTVTLDNSIVAFATSGQAGYCEVGGTITATCSDVHGNAGGDYVGCLAGQNGLNGNIDSDPLFCDKPGDDYTIQNDSPAALASCGHMGALPANCTGPTATEETSWSEVKELFR